MEPCPPTPPSLRPSNPFIVNILMESHPKPRSPTIYPPSQPTDIPQIQTPR